LTYMLTCYYWIIEDNDDRCSKGGANIHIKHRTIKILRIFINQR